MPLISVAMPSNSYNFAIIMIEILGLDLFPSDRINSKVFEFEEGQT